MDQAGHALLAANLIYARANTTNGTTTTDAETEVRPPIYKAIGISLAVASGVFIGISFVLKKIGLLKANEKYNEEAGEGYAYLKNALWWSGMTLMILGEICNFVAYAFVDAILVTPLGALSVVITTILSAIFLKERLSMVGKVGCFLCIVGSVVIVMNAPAEASAATIQEMQHFVIAPGFLSYAGVIIIGCTFLGFWAGPRYGKKSMLVYLSICSLIGGLSVVATQGLGAAIVTQIGGTKQYNQWFLYVLFVFVVCTLLTEIIYLNKALNIYNAALVTPTYYVMFTSSTIVTSAILFRGFKGTPTSIITVVMGFLVICSGVVLLQLSKSAKDVPDAAIFAGDLDQMRIIAEQEQPETEPKADAIRGAAAIVRKFSSARQKMEMEEAKRLHEESHLEPLGEDEIVEWDGLRRRRTTIGSNYSASMRSRANSSVPPLPENMHHQPTHRTTLPRTPIAHPPLGMSHFPDPEEERDEEDRPGTGLSSSIFGTIRNRVARGKSLSSGTNPVVNLQSPTHPVPLTDIRTYRGGDGDIYKSENSDEAYYIHDNNTLGLPPALRDQKTEYTGSGGRHVTIAEDPHRPISRASNLVPPTPPPHSAKRQFSFQNVFRKGGGPQQTDGPPQEVRSPDRKRMGSRHGSDEVVKGATEEERLGLVKGDTRTQSPSGTSSTPSFDEDDEELEPWSSETKDLEEIVLLPEEILRWERRVHFFRGYKDGHMGYDGMI
ncbi:putative duf803 domain membrane protein [Botrytis fragariae]|uniref:Putative duf803 domain membrane protein n=1 Tax=Botrytis fragariae TaxID=1964551 RepID=A0A8H6AWC1_9HELO|nr:putative duf803 domain membrane protein [Botrytis fragariae]KAF5874615.1 putative duf803 domain membrane protein [Botrytis fragariae]